jgi:hypothetical protein
VNWPTDDPPAPPVGKPVRIEVTVGGRRLVARFPRLVTLTIVNKEPETLLVEGHQPFQDMYCGGDNPVFRAEGLPRSCKLRFWVHNPPVWSALNNPFEVPLITLRAIVDPAGVTPGAEVIWKVKGERLPCGGNVYDHFCQVALGQRGNYKDRLAKPRSVTVVVTIEGGGSGTPV